MPELRTQPEAEWDAAEIYDWYEDQRPGLGRAFLARPDECYGGIASNPYRYAVAFDDFRQGMLKKFRYIVYYKVIDGEPIVYRVVHSAREPDAVRRFLTGSDDSP
jgi:plasmid stabilization system protein ParE